MGFFSYMLRESTCRGHAGGEAEMDLGYEIILALIAVYAVSSIVLYVRARGSSPEQKK